MSPKTIVGIGEVLWDSLPGGMFLGGAVFNATYHLNALGHRALLHSCVGRDVLGEEVVRRMTRMGMPTTLLDTSPEHTTGLVLVELDTDGVPSYEIVEDVAWDFIESTDDAGAAIQSADVILYGSLAQRSEVSRATVRAAWSSPAPKCFDVNLRAPHDDRDVVIESLEAADIVKLNDEEIVRVAAWAGLASRAPSELARTMDDVASRFEIGTLCVTLGADGAALRHRDEHRRHPGFEVEVEDTVGAGDAFLAALLDAYCEDAPLDEWLERGNRLAAHVASCRGATPPSGRELLQPR